jgi:hypothetical protein
MQHTIRHPRARTSSAAFPLATIALALAPLLLTPAGCGSLIVTQQSVKSLAGRRGFTWSTHPFDGFVLYVEPDSAAARDLDGVKADARRARQRVLTYLKEPMYEPTVSIFVVDTRERMKDLIGRRSNAMAYHTTNVLCLVWADTWRIGATHELLHVVAMNRWGVPERWVNEGMAVDAARLWRGHDLHALCKHLRAQGELPSLADVTRRYDRLPGLVAYPAAGSFVRFLRESHGLETLRQVWDGGRRVLPAATGMHMEAIETVWLAVVDAAEAEGIQYDIKWVGPGSAKTPTAVRRHCPSA